MVTRRSGVILTLTATPSRLAIPHVGGGSAAYAALVGLSRTLSVELAPQGVRVVCLMPNALPETETIRKNFALFAKTAGITPADFLGRMASTTHLGRLSTLGELAEAAVFVASDHASGMTGTVLNLSGGGVAD